MGSGGNEKPGGGGMRRSNQELGGGRGNDQEQGGRGSDQNRPNQGGGGSGGAGAPPHPINGSPKVHSNLPEPSDARDTLSSDERPLKQMRIIGPPVQLNQTSAPSSSSITPTQTRALPSANHLEGRIEPMRRPDHGGTRKIKEIGLLVNHGGMDLGLYYPVLSSLKPMPVIEFLKENVQGFRDANDVKILRDAVEGALKGLQVTVNHRRTNHKYTIAGLTSEDASDISFDMVDPYGEQPPKTTGLTDYFWDKWNKEIVYKNIPCLELGEGQKSNKVPMEFCEIAKQQRFPKEKLDDGPAINGETANKNGIEVAGEIKKVTGRVIEAPKLKPGNSCSVKVDDVKCWWNLVKFMDGKSVDRWAMIDFTEGKLNKDDFEESLIDRWNKLGALMEKPLVYRQENRDELISEGRHGRLDKLLRDVIEEAQRKDKDKLQLILCVVTKRNPGYKNLKWLSETKIGVVTEFFRLPPVKGLDQWLGDLCLKINAKLGGSNFELSGKLSEFDAQDHVMFIGAHVNHPATTDKPCPSIAAVVGTVNWPAANRYAARVSPQVHRCEKISNFGNLCKDLVEAYYELNKVRPERIVVFRDGVSNEQFGMVLNEELDDLKKAVYTGVYKPLITVIVAQNRYQTRFSVDVDGDREKSGNVPPGTVVDTEIVHRRYFDFFLCSHFGVQGTSKPAHYYVFYDQNSFTSDQLQKLVYDLCFTFVGCTSPMSLVPPVYYADLAACRGRQYQEVVRENALGDPFEQEFYKLHKDLENGMFFV